MAVQPHLSQPQPPRDLPAQGEAPKDHAPHGHRFSDTLHVIRERARRGPVSVAELMELAGPQGPAFLTIFFLLPFMQPIPLPGISTALGLIIALLGAGSTLDRAPWIPKRLARVAIETRTIERLCRALETLLARLERLVRPRAKDLLAMHWLRILNGVLWVLHALILSLPLPIPLSNSLPALVVLLLALGTMEDDIVVIAIAYVGVVLNVAFFAALVAVPMLGWDAVTS